jgi:hypothetical protein
VWLPLPALQSGACAQSHPSQALCLKRVLFLSLLLLLRTTATAPISVVLLPFAAVVVATNRIATVNSVYCVLLCSHCSYPQCALAPLLPPGVLGRTLPDALVKHTATPEGAAAVGGTQGECESPVQ